MIKKKKVIFGLIYGPAAIIGGIVILCLWPLVIIYESIKQGIEKLRWKIHDRLK